MSIVSPNATKEVETPFPSDDLPSHWQLLPLKQMTKPSSAKVDPSQHSDAPYLSLEHIEANTTKIVGQGQGRDVRSTKAAFRAGDVLYGKLRPYLNKVTIPEFDGIASTDILVFPPNDKLDQRYLMRFLNSATVVEYAHHHSMGLQMPRIGFDVLGEIEIPVPPISEQKAIADLIDTLTEQLNSARDRLASIPTLLKRFRQSVLAAACSGQLTADWREVNSETESGRAIVQQLEEKHEVAGGHRKGNAAAPSEDAHDLELDALPDSWGLTDFKNGVAPDRPITYGILKPGPDTPNGIPYVRVADFPGDQLSLAAIKRTTPQIEAQFSRARLRPGDVLLSIRGTVGRVCTVPEALDGANITQDTARLSIQPSLNREYVVRYLQSQPVQRRMDAAQKGVAVRGINIGDVRALQLAVPPIHEQGEIVRRVEALFALADSIESRLAHASSQVERTTQAILAQAFRGELQTTLTRDTNADSQSFDQ